MPQTFASHARYLPPYHYFVAPVLILNMGYHIHVAASRPGWESVWLLLVSVALFVGVALGRSQALTVQDRVIRLEERLRMQRILPAAIAKDVDALTRSQIVALRFASDEELGELVRRVRAGEFESAKAIKQAIRQWRPDELRV